jgi:hypothetical protein
MEISALYYSVEKLLKITDTAHVGERRPTIRSHAALLGKLENNFPMPA